MPNAADTREPLPKREAALNVARFWSALFLGLSLAPYGAHLLELPNKVDLPSEQYLIVQQIYQGWALAGILIGGAGVATLILTVLSRRDRQQFRLALAALLCVVASQAVFWAVTFPVNRVTRNWTQIPEVWEPLRVQWEVSHAIGAVLVMAAFVLSLRGIHQALSERGANVGASASARPSNSRGASPSPRVREHKRNHASP